MSVKNIVQVGNHILREKARLVKDIKSKKTKQVIKDLVDSMRHHNLIGIAAPQIGYKMRIFVTEIRKTSLRKNLEKTEKVRIYINPEIIWSSKEYIVMYEGCGSVAFSQLFGPVKRSKKVLIRAKDEKGDEFEIKANGLLARVLQHEFDHLEGIVFTDKITNIKKIMSRNEYIKKFQK